MNFLVAYRSLKIDQRFIDSFWASNDLSSSKSHLADFDCGLEIDVGTESR